MCCVVCGCIEFCPKQEVERVNRNDFTVLQDRFRKDFKESAQRGCKICNLAYQASCLLTSIRPNPLLLIDSSPEYSTEIHAMPPGDDYDIVEIYATSEAPTSPYIRLGRDVPNRSDSEESIRFLKDCYQNCLRDHRICDQEPTVLPKRIIDISSLKLKLLEPQERTKAVYAALSYTWGAFNCRVLTTETLQQLKSEIPWDSIPVVFKNAINIAQQLGIKYLWIDTVCILQDNELDWEIEASKMVEVFSNASITIAASSSQDPGRAFLREYDAEFHSVSLQFEAVDLLTRFKARRKIPLGIHAMIDSHKTSDPIDTRAWTLQEVELSARVISFTRAELQWKCRGCHSCECNSVSRRPSTLFTPSTGADIRQTNTSDFYAWHMIVEKYSARKLTFPNDKLPALMGLAERSHRLTGSAYVAGLWQDNLFDDLAWRRSPRGDFFPVTQYLAPTFSWMSISSFVDHQPVRHLYAGKRRHLAEIIDCRCELAARTAYGRIHDGLLKICGPTIRATLTCPRPLEHTAYELVIGNVAYKPATGKRVTCEFSIDTPLNVLEEPQTKSGVHNKSLDRSSTENIEPFENIPIRLLGLSSIHHATQFYENFIILGRSKKEPDRYVRLGFGTGKIYMEAAGTPLTEQEKPFQWVPIDIEDAGDSSLDFKLQDLIAIA